MPSSDDLPRPEACPGPDPICAPWEDHLGEVLLTREQIHSRVVDLGTAISRDYVGLQPVLVGVLRGVFFFLADLLREIMVPASVDFIAISRYGPSERTKGVVHFNKDLDLPIEGRHVLFIEDIVDTGLTTAYILSSLRKRSPASLNICTLLDRPRRRIVDFDIAYTGFEIPDCWVVGYGLDYKEDLRQLPHIAVFTPPGRPEPTFNGPLAPQVSLPPLLPRDIARTKTPAAAAPGESK
jgi:hypoxanthine phosphoribosyltransferase